MENKKINIAEILKDCPTGMELDCLMYDNLYFDEVDEDCRYPIGCYTIYDNCRTSVNFTKFGEFNNYGSAKCVIFPKGKTTWEGFHKPFKDGDILISGLEGCEGNPFIFKQLNSFGNAECYCAINCYGELIFNSDNWTSIKGCRLATSKEKEKLFDAINKKGYKWNEEIKILEKLIEPKFKVGAIIQDNGYEVEITKVNVEDELYEYKSINTKAIGSIIFSKQDYWELVSNKFDITTLVPFESKVLVRDDIDEVWLPCFFGGICNSDNNYPYRTVGGERWKCCIPYEGNEHLLNNTADCDIFYKNW